jgi:hypothetical protein
MRGRLGRLRLASLLHRLFPGEKKDLVPRVDEAQFAANLDAIGEEAGSRGIPIIFFKVCCCEEGYNDKLETAARRYGMPVVTAAEVMSVAIAEAEIRREYAGLIREIDGWYSLEEKKSDHSLLFYYRDQCHLNPLGAELAAVALAETLAGSPGMRPAP